MFVITGGAEQHPSCVLGVSAHDTAGSGLGSFSHVLWRGQKIKRIGNTYFLYIFEERGILLKGKKVKVFERLSLILWIAYDQRHFEWTEGFNRAPLNSEPRGQEGLCSEPEQITGNVVGQVTEFT